MKDSTGTQTSKNLNHTQQIKDSNNQDDLQTNGQNGHQLVKYGDEENSSSNSASIKPKVSQENGKQSSLSLNGKNYFKNALDIFYTPVALFYMFKVVNHSQLLIFCTIIYNIQNFKCF